MRRTLIASGLVTLICTACSAPTAQTPTSSKQEPVEQDKTATPKDGRIEPVVFAGVPLPGTALQAKDLAFSDCKPLYDGTALACSSTKRIAILGVVAERAEVTLNTRDNFRLDWTGWEDAHPIQNKRLEDLSYRDVKFFYPSSNYYSACVDAHRKKQPEGTYYQEPNECAKPDTIGSLLYALEKDGWIKVRSWKRTDYYYRQETPLELAIGTEIGVEGYVVQARPTPLAKIGEIFASHQAHEKAVADEKAATDSLINGMKSSQ